MGIVDDDIATVRDRTDMVAVASQFMQVKRVGTRWVGLCPFHGEKTPSFSINADEKLYYCFGCQAKGDVITLVQELQHTDFVGAIEWLAGQCGVQLRYTDKGQGESRKRRTLLIEALERAVDFYHDRLLTGPDAGAGPGLPAPAGLRRRDGAPLPGRLGARRLGPAGPPPPPAGPAAGRHRARVHQPPPAPAGLLPGPGPVPDLRRPGRTPSASAGGSCPAATGPSTATPARPRSTTRARCSTGSTGPRTQR